jgi:hypothetical protein
MLGIILIILLLLFLFGGAGFFPAIPYGYGAGHYGLGIIGVLLIILIVLIVLGRL